MNQQCNILNKKWTVKITVKQQLISATQQINPANDKDTAIIKSSSHTHKKKKKENENENSGERMFVCKIKKCKKKRTDENAAFFTSL